MTTRSITGKCVCFSIIGLQINTYIYGFLLLAVSCVFPFGREEGVSRVGPLWTRNLDGENQDILAYN